MHDLITVTDPITVAYVIKGATNHIDYAKALAIFGDDELSFVEYLLKCAADLEYCYDDNYIPEQFDHLVFAYEIAEPFGKWVISSIVAKTQRHSIHDVRCYAYALLSNNAR